jgi:hypothetical protein
VKLGIGAFGTGSWGPTKNGFGGVAASFAVFADRWRWQIDGGYSIPRTLSLDNGRRGRVQAWWLDTRGCLVPNFRAGNKPMRTLEVPLCLAIETGQAFARGLPPTRNPASASRPWLALGASVGLRWPLIKGFALTTDAELLTSLVRRGRFRIGDETLTEIARVGFRGALGVEVRF